jgi:hypothetical protein
MKALLLFAALTLAHDLYPEDCCGGDHCHPIPCGAVREEPGGYVIIMQKPEGFSVLQVSTTAPREKLNEITVEEHAVAPSPTFIQLHALLDKLNGITQIPPRNPGRLRQVHGQDAALAPGTAALGICGRVGAESRQNRPPHRRGCRWGADGTRAAV